LRVFEKLKNALISKENLLAYPDLKKDFELTTVASNYALGAVLSQGNRPITFISRSLNKTEENYAANEKEMLAIIWALNSLRNYLYGHPKIKIFTDHQPLTYALSIKNHNSKMKRWKAILEEYNYELHYKPGRTNIVADALSRHPGHDHDSNDNTGILQR
jgi:ribonuclease HI